MKSDGGDNLSPKIHNVLRCSNEFQHLMITGCFESTGLKLISKLVPLLVLGLIVMIRFNLHNEFNRLTQSIHDCLLCTELLESSHPASFSILINLSDDILLLALEPLLIDAVHLLLLSKNLCKESLTTGFAWARLDRCNHALSNLRLEAVVLLKLFLCEFLNFSNLEACI